MHIKIYWLSVFLIIQIQKFHTNQILLHYIQFIDYRTHIQIDLELVGNLWGNDSTAKNTLKSLHTHRSLNPLFPDCQPF